MVNQEHNYSCLPACARQLLRDAGVEISEAELVDRIGILEGFGASYITTAEVLSELHPRLRYSGGGVFPEHFHALCQRGVWIARVITLGGRPHAIIVDGLQPDELVAVRDPWGLSGPGSGTGTQATMRLSDFLEHWRWGIHHVIIPDLAQVGGQS
jgi:hypothetical protein